MSDRRARAGAAPAARAAALLLLLCTGARGTAARAEPPLRAAVADTLAPFVQPAGGPNAGGPNAAAQAGGAGAGLDGFTIELFRAIAARLHRPIVFDAMAQAALIPALQSGAVDLLPGPIEATPDRAAAVLFSEGYLWAEDQFSTPAGAPALRVLDGLRGRVLGVRRGGTDDEWATRNAGRFGFGVRRFATAPALFDALNHGAVTAALTDSVTARLESRAAGTVPGMVLEGSRVQLAAAFRRDDPDTRDDVEDALDCLKQDGTVAKLSARWFGGEPGEEDLENLVVPGYGVPGLAGYDPRARKGRCP